MKFISSVGICDTYNNRGFPSDYPEEVIKNEPMFFNSSLRFAYDHGGPITKQFIINLPIEWLLSSCVLDSRVHMLMPGWFPCIPGWHHDDVPRSAWTGQPNYKNPEYFAEHVMGLVNGDIAPTEFLPGEFELSDPDEKSIIYKKWHLELEEQIKERSLTPIQAPSGKHIFFNAHTFHQGVRAKKNGWRWFCRVSRNTNKIKSITNEIRKQVQVYLEFPMEGW